MAEAGRNPEDKVTLEEPGVVRAIASHLDYMRGSGVG